MLSDKQDSVQKKKKSDSAQSEFSQQQWAMQEH